MQEEGDEEEEGQAACIEQSEQVLEDSDHSESILMSEDSDPEEPEDMGVPYIGRVTRDHMNMLLAAKEAQEDLANLKEGDL